MNQNDPLNEEEKNRTAQSESEDISETGTSETEEDVSIYYPDGDAEHMAEDDEEDRPFSEELERKREQLRKKKLRLTKSQISLIVVLFILYTVLLTTASWILFYRPSAPKNEPVPFNTVPVPAGEPGEAEDVGDDPGGYTDEGGSYNVLIVGMDKQANLADVTMLVNVSTAEESISVMQIPRDTLVTTGVSSNKVNALYSSLVKNAYYSGDPNSYTTALDQYAKILEESLCIRIHHAVMVSVEGLVDIVDACGGVEIDVPCDMFYEDPYQDLYIQIGAGRQVLDGYNAMCFVRYRSGYIQADLGRLNAQKIFITALYKKVVDLVKTLNIGRLTDMAGRISDAVYTEMSVSDILFYARSFLKIGMENLRMFTLPGKMDSDGPDGNYYVMNRAGTIRMINDHFNIYSKKIEDNIFDRNHTFCFVENEVLCGIYFGEAVYDYSAVYDAASVDSESIDIPVLYH